MGPHCAMTLGDIQTTLGDKCLPGHLSIYCLTRPRPETHLYFGHGEYIYLLGLVVIRTHGGPWVASSSTNR